MLSSSSLIPFPHRLHQLGLVHRHSTLFFRVCVKSTQTQPSLILAIPASLLCFPSSLLLLLMSSSSISLSSLYILFTISTFISAMFPMTFCQLHGFKTPHQRVLFDRVMQCYCQLFKLGFWRIRGDAV